jgi:hypothetical protein
MQCVSASFTSQPMLACRQASLLISSLKSQLLRIVA